MADEQTSEQQINRNDRAEAEPIGPIAPEDGSEGSDAEGSEGSDAEGSDPPSHAEALQGSRSSGESPDRARAGDIEALAARLAKTEAELETVKKAATSRARVRIETKTVPPVRKDAKPEPSATPTRQEQRRRYLWGK